VLSVVADRERLIRWPRYLLLTGAHIHNRSFRRTSQIRNNLETVAAEKALEIAISSKLATASFIVHYPDEEVPTRRDRSGWASIWATVELPPAIALVNTGGLHRWDEKAGLPRDAIRSQCSTCSRHNEKETGNEKE
jgi:hypothetical protein